MCEYTIIKHTGEYRGAAHSTCNLKYSVPNKISVAFHNACNYDYHFIIKELAEEFTCLGKNTKKYINGPVPIEKVVTRIDKNGEKTRKKYILAIAIYWERKINVNLIIKSFQ